MPAIGQPSPTPSGRQIAQGADWRLVEYVCTAGPDDRPFEEAHECTSIAAVVEGSFNYRTGNDRALLYPGALLFGNHGTCFECGHDHGTGDRCVALQMAPEFFSEIAATAAGSSRYVFTRAMLPATAVTMRFVARVQGWSDRVDAVDSEQWAITSIENVVRATSGHVARPVTVSPRDGRRISDVIRYIEAHAAEPLDLAGLAVIARLSRYHFLRVFHAATGRTPYQLTLDFRMRHAAVRLQTTDDTVSAIAFDTGFGDLSTFNRRFRDQFGKTPREWRRDR